MESRVVLITGASRGIGRELTLGFAKEGWRVAINFLKEKGKAEEVCAGIARNGGHAGLFPADISDPACVRSLIGSVVEKEGRIDALVNNAGVGQVRSLLHTSDDEWDTILSTNLSGSFYALRECARLMAKQGGGNIINIASIAAVRGIAGSSSYASAKAGLVALTKSAARELGRANVRVNAVMPGFHMTEMGRSSTARYIEDVKKESVLGATTDIAELVAFVLLLARSTTVSGQVFNWDSRII